MQFPPISNSRQDHRQNGHVTLDGGVGSRLDKTLAWTAARSVSGVFSVTGNLTIG
jgi:osmotically-inducible protein OsmY